MRKWNIWLSPLLPLINLGERERIDAKVGLSSSCFCSCSRSLPCTRRKRGSAGPLSSAMAAVEEEQLDPRVQVRREKRERIWEGYGEWWILRTLLIRFFFYRGKFGLRRCFSVAWRQVDCKVSCMTRREGEGGKKEGKVQEKAKELGEENPYKLPENSSVWRTSLCVFCCISSVLLCDNKIFPELG